MNGFSEKLPANQQQTNESVWASEISNSIQLHIEQHNFAALKEDLENVKLMYHQKEIQIGRSLDALFPEFGVGFETTKTIEELRVIDSATVDTVLAIKKPIEKLLQEIACEKTVPYLIHLEALNLVDTWQTESFNTHVEIAKHSPFFLDNNNICLQKEGEYFVAAYDDMKSGEEVISAYIAQYQELHFASGIPHELLSEKRKRYLATLSERLKKIADTFTIPLETLLESHAKDDISDYVSLLTLKSREILRDNFGFEFANLTTLEQFYFLNYLKRTTAEKAETMQAFTHNYGVAGMRTFLALERDSDISGDDIVRFGTEQEKAGEIFTSFGHLLDTQEALERFIQKETNCEATQCEAMIAAAQARVKEGAYTYLINAIKTPGAAASLPEIDQAIARARSLSAAFTTYFSHGGRSVEELNSFKSETMAGTELSHNQALHDQLTTMYRKNYQQLGYTKEAIGDLVHNLEDNLTHDGTRIWLWQIQNQHVLSFAITEEEPELKHVHVSALNINPDLATSRAGKDLLEQLTEHYKEKDFTLTAEASPDNFRGYSQMEWVATQIVEDDLGQESHLFKIAIFPQAEFESKKLSRRDIGLLAAGEKTIPGVEVYETDDPREHPTLATDQFITRFVRIPKTKTAPERYIYLLEQLPKRIPTAPRTESGA